MEAARRKLGIGLVIWLGSGIGIGLACVRWAKGSDVALDISGGCYVALLPAVHVTMVQALADAVF